MRKIKLILGALALVSMFGAMSCKNASAPASNANGEPAPTTTEGKAWAQAVGGYEFVSGKLGYKFSKYGTKGTFDWDLTMTGGDNDPKNIKSVEIKNDGTKVVMPNMASGLPDVTRTFTFEKINDVVVALKYIDDGSTMYYHRKDYYDWFNFINQKTFKLAEGGEISFSSGDFAASYGFSAKYTPAGGGLFPVTFKVEGDGKTITKVTLTCTHADLNGKVAKIEGMKEGTKKIIIDGKEYIAQ